MMSCGGLNRGACQKRKRRAISGSASRSLKRWACRWSSSGAAASMTVLTWTRGWTTISAEGGPERRLYGP